MFQILSVAKTWELVKQTKSWNALLPGVLIFCAMDIEVEHDLQDQYQSGV